MNDFFSGMEEVNLHEDDMEPERKKLKVESAETVKGMQTGKTEMNDDIIDWLQSLKQFV